MPEPEEIGHQVRFPKTFIGYFKKGCWEIPEIMAGNLIGLCGIALAAAGLFKYYNNEGDKREYKKVYDVVRPDDPRISYFRNPVYTEYIKKAYGKSDKNKDGKNKDGKNIDGGCIKY